MMLPFLWPLLGTVGAVVEAVAVGLLLGGPDTVVVLAVIFLLPYLLATEI